MFPPEAKILIVDDSTYARNSLKESLKQLNYTRLLEAGDVAQSQKLLIDELVKKDPVHLLITDLTMPGQSGLDLIRWVRAQNPFRGIPVVLITSSQQKGEVLQAGQLGVSHFLIKPYDTGMIMDRLASTWTKHGEKYWAALQNPPK